MGRTNKIIAGLTTALLATTLTAGAADADERERPGRSGPLAVEDGERYSRSGPLAGDDRPTRWGPLVPTPRSSVR